MLKDETLKLMQWRVIREISRDELAQKTGLTTRTLYNYETDINKLRKASYETILRIASALEISVNQIFLGNVSEKPK